MPASAPGFTLPRIDGPPASLHELLQEGPLVLVFAHADCPTSTLTLRRLATLNGSGPRIIYVFEEAPEDAARLARRSGVATTVLSESPPYEVSRAFGVETVPTAIRIDGGGAIVGTVVGWDADGYASLLETALPDGEPRRKPGCGARWTYEPASGGLDEQDDMVERGWTDGLPVIPPTPERVQAMLDGRDPTASLGMVPPAHGEATLERVAACAVLAGCRPAFFPVVVAAVEAALDPGFNAHGVAVTTQPAGSVVVVNGPGRETAGVNGGMGALGPGTRANATIGRALRLVLTLTGGARPGGLDRATLGNPGKVSCCFAENEEASPWEPLHVERGFRPDATTVTVVAADAPLSISDHRSRTAEELAATLAWAAAGQWSPFWWPMDDTSLFVVCPEHASLFAAAGWSKARLRAGMFEAVQRPAGELRRGETTPFVKGSADDALVHKWTRPEKIVLVVAGGDAGRFSAVFGPCDGMKSEPVTREVQWST